MVLFELLSRKTPWDGLRESQIISALMMMQGERPELPARVVAELAPVEALMRELWADAPMARPAVDGACVARLVAMLDACTDAERRAAAQAIAQAEEARRRAAAAQAEAGVVVRAQAQHDAGARALEALAAEEGCPVQELLAADNIGFCKLKRLDPAVLRDGLRYLLAVNAASLTTLWLNGNQIGDKGAVGLGKAIKVNGSLTELNLWRNQIGDAGAVGLGKALEVNGSLTTLWLSGNQIGDASKSAIRTSWLSKTGRKESDMNT